MSALLIVFVLLNACATLPPDESEGLKITEVAKPGFEPAAFQQHSGMTSYSYKSKPFLVQWVACNKNGAKKAIAVMNRDKAGFDGKSFCAGWIAQAFLKEGLSVVGINRPGFGRSTGTADFSGSQSVTSIMSAMKDSQDTLNAKIKGIWGYSSGAIAAAFVAKEAQTFDFLLLGGGIYDLEETLARTGDEYIKADLQAISDTGGPGAFEERSLSLDPSELPQRIVMYHGKDDTAISPNQARSVYDNLSVYGYQATLQVLEGVNHDIPPPVHMQILQIMARSLK